MSCNTKTTAKPGRMKGFGPLGAANGLAMGAGVEAERGEARGPTGPTRGTGTGTVLARGTGTGTVLAGRTGTGTVLAGAGGPPALGPGSLGGRLEKA